MNLQVSGVFIYDHQLTIFMCPLPITISNKFSGIKMNRIMQQIFYHKFILYYRDINKNPCHTTIYSRI